MMRHKVTTDLLYPNLWRGCRFAAAPLLGQSGTTLRDFSGRNNHGAFSSSVTVTNTIAGGRNALNFASANIGLPNNSLPSGTGARSYVFWAVTHASAPAQTVFNSGPDTTGNRITGTLQQTVIAIAVSGHNYGATISSSTALNHYAITLPAGANSDAFVFYLNGRLLSAATITGTAKTVDTGTTANYLAGRYDGLGWYGQFVEFAAYNRQLTHSEIQIMATRPGIAYETKRRSRGYVAAAGGANTSSNLLLLGVG